MRTDCLRGLLAPTEGAEAVVVSRVHSRGPDREEDR